MAKKWIINNGVLIIGRVKYHYELIQPTMERNKTIGGGYWEYYKNKLYFYSTSQEFGSVAKDVFFSALEKTQLPDYIGRSNINVIFSELDYFSDVLKYDDNTNKEIII